MQSNSQFHSNLSEVASVGVLIRRYAFGALIRTADCDKTMTRIEILKTSLESLISTQKNRISVLTPQRIPTRYSTDFYNRF